MRHFEHKTKTKNKKRLFLSPQQVERAVLNFYLLLDFGMQSLQSGLVDPVDVWGQRFHLIKGVEQVQIGGGSLAVVAVSRQWTQPAALVLWYR